MPAGGRSKRQRKQRNIGSLKSKSAHDAASNEGLNMLADEFRQQLGSDEDAANLIMLPKRKGHELSKNDADTPAELSRYEKRKLKQVEAKREQRDSLSQVLSQLAQSALTPQQLQLLRPVHRRGQRETKRQKLGRALQLERAGLQVPEDAQLYKRPAAAAAQMVGDETSSSSSDEGGEQPNDRAAPLGKPSAAAAAPAPVAAVAAVAAAEAASVGGDPAELSLGEDDSESEGADVDSDSQQQQGPAPKRRRLDSADDAGRAALEAQRAAIAKLRAEIAASGDAAAPLGDDETAATAASAAAAAAAAAAAGPHRVRNIVRPVEMAESRSKLPILAMEQEVMEVVSAHDVVVLCGETGCGKTTQVPQFLYEAGYGCREFPERAGAIGVTQPRRVAAVSTAERVAAELGTPIGQVVGYQVRYDKRVGATASLKFMTDGILLRELQQDFLLSRYSVLLIDEAHERSLNTDLLLGMLSRVVPLRRALWREWVDGGGTGAPVYPLKLIIMSATLRTEDFVGNRKLFPRPPPVVSVPARQFPVVVHFSRRTELDDYVGAALRKVCRIHEELPPGGILVFVTGQREVEYLCRKLTQHYEAKARQRQRQERGKGRAEAAAAARTAPLQEFGQEDATAGGPDADDEDAQGPLGDSFGGDLAEAAAGEAELRALSAADVAAMRDDYNSDDDEDEEEVMVMGGDGFTQEQLAEAERQFMERHGHGFIPAPGETAASDAAAEPDIGNPRSATAATAAASVTAAAAPSPQAAAAEPELAPVRVLPLYAMLPPHLQARVFKPPPAGHRLIVVATNVAETSLTIPGIRYVVDAGRSKQKLLEASGALAKFEVGWISKASAEQRAGRAGRTGPGHCYRLYSSAHFNDTFPQHSPPEILNTPLEGVLLVMKRLEVDKVANFPFPTPPQEEALRAAEQCLWALGALLPDTKRLTDLGRAMAAFPITPRHARMLLEVARLGAQQQHQEQPDQGQQGQQGLQAPASAHMASVAARTLPYAVALAAALSVESPFVHVDNPTAADGDDPADAAASKSRLNAARQAHGRLRNSTSDALSALAALCGYEAAGAGGAASYCAGNFLHARNLKEMAELHKQLARTLLQLLQPASGSATARQGGGDGGGGAPNDESEPSVGARGEALQAARMLRSFSPLLGGDRLASSLSAALQPPPPDVQDMLRRACVAGWADQVSRRVRSAEHVHRLVHEQGKKRHAVRYSSCSKHVEEEVFLHPRSALHAAAPEYVVYTQLLRSAKRPYMAVVTAVEPQWLAQSGTPLCSFSAPLLEPAPFYKPDADVVLSWHDASYGPLAWGLPVQARRHPDAKTRAAVFAAALLAGRVLPALVVLQPMLVAPAASAAKPELQGLPRVGELVGALLRANVDSRAALCATWQRQPEFLKAEVTGWVHKHHVKTLQRLWPQLLQQAAAAESQTLQLHASKASKERRKTPKPWKPKANRHIS